MKRSVSFILTLIGATIAIILIAGGFFALLSLNSEKKVSESTQETESIANKVESATKNESSTNVAETTAYTPQRIYEYTGSVSSINGNILTVTVNAIHIEVQIESTTLLSTITTGMDSKTALPIVLESTAIVSSLEREQRIRIYSVHDITKTNTITARQIQILQ